MSMSTATRDRGLPESWSASIPQTPRAPIRIAINTANSIPKKALIWCEPVIDCHIARGSSGPSPAPRTTNIETSVREAIPSSPTISADKQYRRALATNSRAICGSRGGGGWTRIARDNNYLLAPQWQVRSPEQQLPGSANWPSGPMQVCVMAHQKRPSPERGTVGSGSDQTYWLFQCSAEHSPGRSVLKRSGMSLMLRLL